MSASELIEESGGGSLALRFIADLLTLFRVLCALFILLLGFMVGARALSTALITILCGWATDWVDGSIARSSGMPQTWVGRAEFACDLTMVFAFFLFIVVAGLFPILPALALLLAAVMLVIMKPTENMVNIVAAPVFALPIAVSFAGGWVIGVCYVVFITSLIIVRWDRLVADARKAHVEAAAWSAR